MKQNFNIGLAIILLGMLAAAIIFWNTIFVYPIKIFVVFLHELSHGLAAVLTGGEIIKIEVTADQGGVCWFRGGWDLVTLPAGYLGSMLWGGLIVVLAARTKLDKLIAMAIGLMMVVIALLFIRNMFGFVFCLLFGIGLFFTGMLLPGVVIDLVLKFLGLTSVLYAVLDIKDDLISRTVEGSDAYQMSRLIPLPPVVWGIIWMIIAGIVALLLLKTAFNFKLKPAAEKSATPAI